MSEWVWEARARTGEVRKGILEADSADAVSVRLKAQNLSPVRVRKKPAEISISFGSPVSAKELVVFVRQFATMIDAGLPLVQCLEILSSQGDNAAFNKILKDVKAYVEQGSTFSDALRRHPKVFDELFVSLIAAGEMGGILDTILNRLAVYIEKKVKLKRQVRGALVYPAGILGVAILVIAVMLTWVIPSFAAMFTDFGGELPAMTQLVIDMSDWFLGHIIVIVLIIGGVSGGVVLSYRSRRGKKVWHRLLLTMPAVGPVFRKIAVARFTRTLGTLLSSGVPILDALTTVAKASGNVVIEAAIMKTAERIREGYTMAEPLAQVRVFPSMVVQMIGVGEQTGALDQMLNKIADYYEDEVDVAVAALTRMIEPLMMVFIGGVVGFIMIAMYMPIFDIAGKMKAQ